MKEMFRIFFYVAPKNIECYKCHKYCRSGIVPSMKKKTYIRYTKIWKRKEKEEEQVKKEKVPKIASLEI
jgi:hypothetical protein